MPAAACLLFAQKGPIAFAQGISVTWHELQSCKLRSVPRVLWQEGCVSTSFLFAACSLGKTLAQAQHGSAVMITALLRIAAVAEALLCKAGEACCFLCRKPSPSSVQACLASSFCHHRSHFCQLIMCSVGQFQGIRAWFLGQLL